MYYKQRLLEFILLCFIPGAVPEKFQRGLEVDVEVKLYEVNVNPGIFLLGMRWLWGRLETIHMFRAKP